MPCDVSAPEQPTPVRKSCSNKCFSSVLRTIANRCREPGDAPMRRLTGALRAAMEDSIANRKQQRPPRLSRLSADAGQTAHDE